jgi:hypothetical protein
VNLTEQSYNPCFIYNLLPFRIHETMFKTACKYNEDTIFYFDNWGNKYVATGGTLSWRLKNPGLVHKRTPSASHNGSIGSCDGFAIFAESEHGHQALIDWLNSKSCLNMTLAGIAKYYRPQNSDSFLTYLSNATEVSQTKKIKDFSLQEFQLLQYAICRLCGYTHVGDEQFVLLPKISAKIENFTTKEEFYLIANCTILSKNEAIEWVLTHRLDAVIVHENNDRIHLRSRPHHGMEHIKLNERDYNLSEGQFETICRTIGEKKTGQCIWAFINGISNSREDALKSAQLISDAAEGEQVLSLPNDRSIWTLGNLITAIAQKGLLGTAVVNLAVRFFRHLINLSDEDTAHPPIIIFVHSQGAIIAEHALEHLKDEERKKLRIFTFGGGSFISTHKCHPDSHNYASASDLISQGGAPNQQNLALALYHGAKKGESQETVINRLALRDAILCFNSHEDALVSTEKFETWIQKRKVYYVNEIQKLEITILEPGCHLEHSFKNNCYQNVVQVLVGRYRKKSRKS